MFLLAELIFCHSSNFYVILEKSIFVLPLNRTPHQYARMHLDRSVKILIQDHKRFLSPHRSVYLAPDNSRGIMNR